MSSSQRKCGKMCCCLHIRRKELGTSELQIHPMQKLYIFWPCYCAHNLNLISEQFRIVGLKSSLNQISGIFFQQNIYKLDNFWSICNFAFKCSQYCYVHVTLHSLIKCYLSSITCRIILLDEKSNKYFNLLRNIYSSTK